MKGALMLVFATALISGVSIYINKFGVSVVSPSIFTLLKNATVALFLISIIFGLGEFRRLRAIGKRGWGKLLLVGLLGGSAPFILFFKGLHLTSSASASFMHKTLFVWAILFAFIFLKERPTRSHLIAGALVLLGNLFLLLKLSDVAFNIGDLLVLAAAVMWAAEFVLSKHILKGLSPNLVAFGRMFFGSLFILVYVTLVEGSAGRILLLTPPQLGWVAITSIFLLAFVLTWYHGLAGVQVATATLVLMLGAPVTALLRAVSGTPMTGYQFTGVLLIAGGIGYMLARLRAPQPQSLGAQ